MLLRNNGNCLKQEVVTYSRPFLLHHALINCTSAKRLLQKKGSASVYVMNITKVLCQKIFLKEATDDEVEFYFNNVAKLSYNSVEPFKSSAISECQNDSLHSRLLL